MNLFARAVSDRRGHGVQVPQALDGPGGVDAAERAGEAVAVAAGRQPDVTARQRLGTAAHYAFAGFLGVVYGLGRPRTARVSFAPALAYGTGAWMLADEGLMPALGLSRGPRELDYRVLAYGWLGHCVYAATMEAAICALENIRTSSGRKYRTADAQRRAQF